MYKILQSKQIKYSFSDAFIQFYLPKDDSAFKKNLSTQKSM